MASERERVSKWWMQFVVRLLSLLHGTEIREYAQRIIKPWLSLLSQSLHDSGESRLGVVVGIEEQGVGGRSPGVLNIQPFSFHVLLK